MVQPARQLAPRRRVAGSEAADRRRAPGPTRIFCFNDLLALGALHGLAELGVGVPDDIAVIGIDDIEECRYVRPTLTSISPDKAEIARRSVALLAERLAQPPDAATSGREIEVDFRLVSRDST